MNEPSPTFEVENHNALRKDLASSWKKASSAAFLTTALISFAVYIGKTPDLTSAGDFLLALLNAFMLLAHQLFLLEVWMSERYLVPLLLLGATVWIKFCLAQAALHLIPQVLAQTLDPKEVEEGKRWSRRATTSQAATMLSLVAGTVVLLCSLGHKLYTDVPPSGLLTLAHIFFIVLLLSTSVLTTPLVLPSGLRKGRTRSLKQLWERIHKHNYAANGMVWSSDAVTDEEAVNTLKYLADRRLQGLPLDVE